MLWLVEDFVEGGVLDDLARVHHEHPVGDLGDHAEVVGDDDDGEVALAIEPVDQLQDLGLDRHVERRGRLVGDQHVGFERQRHGDHDALPHTAGELVRVEPCSPVGVGDADRPQQLDRLGLGFLLGDVAVRADHLGDLVADAIDGVQRAHRVLEDHRDLLAADVPQLIVVSPLISRPR